MSYLFKDSHKIDVQTLRDTFNQEEIELISQKLLVENHHNLNGRVFDITCQHTHDTIYLRVLLKNTDSSFFYPIDAQYKMRNAKEKPKIITPMMIDYIQSYLNDYFQDENLFLTIEWSEHETEGLKFMMKGQIFNVLLEKQADQYIKDHTH